MGVKTKATFPDEFTGNPNIMFTLAIDEDQKKISPSHLLSLSAK